MTDFHRGSQLASSDTITAFEHSATFTVSHQLNSPSGFAVRRRTMASRWNEYVNQVAAGPKEGGDVFGKDSSFYFKAPMNSCKHTQCPVQGQVGVFEVRSQVGEEFCLTGTRRAMLMICLFPLPRRYRSICSVSTPRPTSIHAVVAHLKEARHVGILLASRKWDAWLASVSVSCSLAQHGLRMRQGLTILPILIRLCPALHSS